MGEMRRADVPNRFVEVATDGWVLNDGPDGWDSAVRAMLAAVLPLHEQQVREQLKLTTQWGVRHEHPDDGMPIITWQRTEQQARDLYAEIHAHDGTARLVRRELGQWRECAADGGDDE